MKVEDYLNNIDYGSDAGYVPSDFALEFINFVKLVNGDEGEENLTPVLHYKILQDVAGPETNIANMIYRGSAKSALFAEYMFLYLAVYGEIPGFGKINYALYVSDSIENGVKKMRLRLEGRIAKSTFLKAYVPTIKFTDIRWYFMNADNKEFVVTGHGAKALALNSTLYTETGTTTIGECKIGDKIYGSDGKLASITAKSEIFNKPMYQLELDDGRTIDVSIDHINSVLKYGIAKNLPTSSLLTAPLFRIKANGTRNYTFQIRNTAPLEYPEKEFKVDPYTLGLLLGDGSIKADGSNVLHGHKDDISFYKQHIPYDFGSAYVDKRNPNVVSLTIKDLSANIRQLGIAGKSCASKAIPNAYFYGSIVQRQKLLQGLIDTDGSVSPEGKVTFCSKSLQLCQDVMALVRSLGGTARLWEPIIIKEVKYYKLGIWLNLHCAFLPRKANREKFNKSINVAITGIHKIEDVSSQCISINSSNNEFLTNNYTRTHNTGVRGTVELNTRPQLAILDDLLSDDDARSDTVIASVEDVVYKAIDYALHPSRHKIIWSGTPFNARDPLYKAIESNAWKVNVFPVCEEYPCEEKDFKGSWEDRFPYSYVKHKYETARKLGRVDTFNQEMMLRIMSDEDRLIKASEIAWYKRKTVLDNKDLFNFYITTDFATSEKTSADYSVISVWAYNNIGDWLWVDGICAKHTMDKNINALFRLAQEYSPQSVGIEVSGQQKGFISWVQNEMLTRNIYFPLASENNNGTPGIRPNTQKMTRFHIVVPLFKMHKIFFPKELKEHPAIIEAVNELSLVSPSGMKSKHDDFLDTISMLPMMQAWKPSQVGTLHHKPDSDMWDIEVEPEQNRIASYVV